MQPNLARNTITTTTRTHPSHRTYSWRYRRHHWHMVARGGKGGSPVHYSTPSGIRMLNAIGYPFNSTMISGNDNAILTSRVAFFSMSTRPMLPRPGLWGRMHLPPAPWHHQSGMHTHTHFRPNVSWTTSRTNPTSYRLRKHRVFPANSQPLAS